MPFDLILLEWTVTYLNIPKLAHYCIFFLLFILGEKAEINEYLVRSLKEREKRSHSLKTIQ